MEKTLEKRSELFGLLTLSLNVILLLSLLSYPDGNWLGLVGYGLGFALHYTFGMASYLIILYAGFWGWRMLVGRVPERFKMELAGFGVFLFSASMLLEVAATAYSGTPFHLLYTEIPMFNLHRLLSTIGTSLVFSGSAIGSILVMFDIRPVPLIKQLLEKKNDHAPTVQAVVTPPPPPPPAPKKRTPSPRVAAIAPAAESPYSLPKEIAFSEGKRINPSALKNDLQKQAAILEETLANFGIEAKVGEINCGPTIASFEVLPPVGVKVQKIKALEKDIALNMQAQSIRIIAPIPGKAAVGVEVPSPHPQPVNFKELLATYQQGTKVEIPLLLGKTVNGSPLITDLTRMPHLIIAGATGSGKSVCLNAIIMSMLMNMRPSEVRLMMVDPKKVELTGYSELPHMIAPVITEPHEACVALKWLVREMESRYATLKEAGVRNITSYNAKASEKLPYMVCIVDELADLMMASSSDIETPITRIAQMARAVGIHLILATQRPSREVITGLIKANFPARIAFKVANRINSQIILDETGAETLMGNGDMLMLPPGTAHLVRAQGVYVSDQDIQKVVASICRRSPPNYMIESFQPQHMGESDAPKDSLYSEALLIVQAAGVASTTFLQRKLKIGYARAASIVDQLEDNGIIGPQEGSKPRKVLVRK